MLESRITIKSICDPLSSKVGEVKNLARNNSGAITALDGVENLRAGNALLLENQTLEQIRQNADVNTFSGYTKDQLHTFNRNKYCFRMLLNTDNRHYPEQFMMGVNDDDEIIVWGQNGYNVFSADLPNSGSTNVTMHIHNPKKGISKIKEISASTWAIYVLYEDGDLYAMGRQTEGQFGIGNTAQQYTLTKINDNVSYLVSTCSGYHREKATLYVLKNDNTVWGAGSGKYGQLGTGGYPDTVINWVELDVPYEVGEYPVEVTADTVYVTSAFVRTNKNNIYASGYNNYGQLGNGNKEKQATFQKVQLPETVGNIVKMELTSGTRLGDSAYYRTSVWVLDDKGDVYSWGHNKYGQLGVGDNTERTTPTKMPPVESGRPIKDIISSKTSWGFCLFITDNNELWGVGCNTYGQMATGDTTDINTSRFITDDVNRVWVSVGSRYTYFQTITAEKNNGKLYGWGNNAQGQLGLGHDDVVKEVTPLYIDRPVKQFSYGGDEAQITHYILTPEGRVFAAGDNAFSHAGGRGSQNSGENQLFTEIFNVKSA